MKSFLSSFLLVALLLGLFLTSACKKESPNDNTVETIYAGVYDESFIYHEYIPSQQIAVTWDSVNLYGVGYDSIDLDLDGKYDINFVLNVLNKDSMHLINGTPIPFPSLCMLGVNGLQFMVELEVVYIGLGATSKVRWIDTLNYEEPININSKWLEVTDCTIRLWGENPTTGLFSFGGWYAVPARKFVGIRFNGNYGWLEIDTSIPESPKLIRYAIQK